MHLHRAQRAQRIGYAECVHVVGHEPLVEPLEVGRQEVRLAATSRLSNAVTTTF
ncbi:MAG: hypothetical protein ACK501_04185 [Planctomycetota bacterium]